MTKGVNIVDVLNEFFADFRSVDYIVGHNVSFDLNMIRAELNRLIINPNNIEKLSEFQTHLTTINTSTNIYTNVVIMEENFYFIKGTVIYFLK